MNMQCHYWISLSPSQQRVSEAVIFVFSLLGISKDFQTLGIMILPRCLPLALSFITMQLLVSRHF